DYIFRVLGAEYLQRYDLCHIQPTLDNNTVTIETNTNTTNPEKYSNAASHLKNLMGDAPFCDVCGHTTVRNGTCYRCLNCGNSMGCS
ncbi:hypothetical protein U2075_14670, partial [Listeria monocytogenes]|uniref:hypothetical protein n=1 Tax=Listeria monocytogenes TaxID=1639 RepID=UPI002FDBC2DC